MSLINKNLKTAISLLSVVILCSFTMFYNGCGSDSTPTTPAATTDTNVVIYPSIDIPVAKAVDLYLGAYVPANDPKADLGVTPSGPVSFFFSTGPSATKVFLVDTSGTTKDAFLSLGSVSAWGSSGAVIQESNFTLNNTQSFGLISPGMTKLPTYGFYLQGKFSNQTTYSKVYGILHVNSGPAGVNQVINVSIKINKASLNKFTN